TTFVTLDGVMQAPGGPEEDQSGGFRYGGWSAPYWDDDLAAFMSDTMGTKFDLLLGRRTYDIFAGFWPNAPEDETSRPLNEATKYVASRGRPNLTWKKSVLLEGDVADAVAALKSGDEIGRASCRERVEVCVAAGPGVNEVGDGGKR